MHNGIKYIQNESILSEWIYVKMQAQAQCKLLPS